MIPLVEKTIASEAAGQGVLKKKALRSLSELPPFSPILNRVLASLTGADASFVKLGDLIEKDTVLSGNLLHLVNSAAYARRGAISSVRHALSLLGIDKVRNAVVGMSIARMWNKMRMPASWSMARFNMHSAAVAILSDLLAQRVVVTYPEGAFVGGLLHDVGSLLIAVSLTGEHEQILQLTEPGARLRLECERTVLGFTHAELSADALAFWNLPDPIRTAVRFHHDPASDRPSEGPGPISLSRVLDAANQYVNSMGVSILIENGPEWRNPALIETLGIEKDRLELVLIEFKIEYDAMAQFFQ